jgi:hypothetical protein
MIEVSCYNYQMQKLILIFVLFVLSNPSFSCRYSIMEQNGRYFVYHKLVGDLPAKDEKISSDLTRGIRDVKVEKKKNQKLEQEDNSSEKTAETQKESEPREIRIRILFDSDSEESAKAILNGRCPQ